MLHFIDSFMNASRQQAPVQTAKYVPRQWIIFFFACWKVFSQQEKKATNCIPTLSLTLSYDLRLDVKEFLQVQFNAIQFKFIYIALSTMRTNVNATKRLYRKSGWRFRSLSRKPEAAEKHIENMNRTETRNGNSSCPGIPSVENPGTLIILAQWLRLCTISWKVMSSNHTASKLPVLVLLLVKDYNDNHIMKNLIRCLILKELFVSLNCLF